MLISIIVPVYNVEKYIAQCLESLINQTYADTEIIVINDGSTDSSYDICRLYAEQSRNIKLFSKSNGGLVSAWKEGLEHCNGEYVCFVDSDDFVAADYVKTMVDSAQGVDMVCMNCMRYSDDGKALQLKINALAAGEYLTDEAFYSRFIVGPWKDKCVANCRWAKLIKTSIVKKYAQFCSEQVVFGEDQQLMAGVLLGCKKLAVLDEYKYFYRRNPESITHSYKKDLWQKSKLLIKTIKDIPEMSAVPNIDEQLRLQLLSYLYECLKNEHICGGGLSKEYFLSIADDAQKLGLFEVKDKSLPGKFDKILFNLVRKKKYRGTKTALNLYKLFRKTL